MPRSQPTFQEGAEVHISGKLFSIKQVPTKPSVCCHYPVKKQRTGSNEIVTVDLLREYCFAKDAVNTQYLLEVIYEPDSRKTNLDKLKIPIKRETHGQSVYLLHLKGKIKGRRDNHVAYIWRLVFAIDARDNWNWKKKENILAEQIRKSIPIGSVLVLQPSGNRYQIDAFLSASGAFSTVFRATDLRDSSSVVVKVQHRDKASHEADILRALNGKRGIVPYVDYGAVDIQFANIDKISHRDAFHQLPNTSSFGCVVAGYIDGTTLDRYIKRKHDSGQITCGVAIGIAQQLCEIIDAIHKNGYLHLDLKPQNIIIDERQKLTIVDMGSVVKKGEPFLMVGAGAHAAPEIREWLLNQPTNWMFLSKLLAADNAPNEVLQRQRFASQSAISQVSEASDVFSVGAILFHILVGREPRHLRNDNESFIAVEAVLIHENDFSEDAKRFIPALYQALAINPASRFRSCSALSQEISCLSSSISFPWWNIWLRLRYAIFRSPTE